MTRFISADQLLIFRDGKPWGAGSGSTGGVHPWPFPSVVAGAIRSSIGLARRPDFFSDVQRTASILNIHVSRQVPLWVDSSDRPHWVFPAPADAVAYAAVETGIDIPVPSYKPLDKGCGTDFPWTNWYFPTPPRPEKPAPRPAFWYESSLRKWLAGEGFSNTPPKDVGLSAPSIVVKTHTAIDPKSRLVAEGQLYNASGITWQTKEPAGAFQLAVEITGAEAGDDMLGHIHLGGERRLAHSSDAGIPWPESPPTTGPQRFLRLMLVTPGQFGGWCPSWLLPQGSESETETPWVNVPGTDHQVRLASAVVLGWRPLSGWDYATRAPKATVKLVPEGSIYLLELKDPSSAPALTEHFWLQPMEAGPASEAGFGLTIVGSADSIVKSPL